MTSDPSRFSGSPRPESRSLFAGPISVSPAAPPVVVLYGNSVFLAGIRAELLGRAGFDMLTVEPDCPDAADRIRACRPSAVLFDLAAAQPDFAITLLRERPGLLLIGVDPSSDEILVLSGRPAQALSVVDLVNVIRQKQSSSDTTGAAQPAEGADGGI